MQIYRSLDEIPSTLGATAVSVGNFDGVHRGHRLILGGLSKARARSLKAIAVVFDPHPMRVLRPAANLKLITPLEHRLELLRCTGMDAVVVLPFTRQLAGMSASDFASRILRDALRAKEVHEGENFRFGHHAQGGISDLQQLGQALGFSVIAHSACRIRGLTVSSTRIRELISKGKTGLARLLLGRSFSIVSTAASGRGLGARLTVPTINLAEYPELVPANGVYVSRLRIGPEWFDAVTNVGNRPTFGGESFAIESYLFGFRPVDLGPETRLELEFHRKLRDEKRWPSPAALKEQIGLDAARAERYHHLRQLLAADRAQEPVPLVKNRR